jgi:hypothetical protein
VKKHGAVSQAICHATLEEPVAQAISFVVRIWKQEGTTNPDCRGWVEHVQSGQRTFFLGVDQLTSIISEHIGVTVPTSWRNKWQKRLVRWQMRQWLNKWKLFLKHGD